MNQILAEYDIRQGLYDNFRRYCENLVSQILQFHGISVHVVQSRLKTRKSLNDKVLRPGKNYRAITDITDLAGIRVITYFDDDVDRVGKVVEDEFAVDRAHSIDKRKSLAPDQFGYSSLHYVVSLSPTRSNLIECRKFNALKREIQIRSILQHTWAEIEHDLGYKPSSDLPDEIRRSFSILAGTLEGVDRDFRRLRDEIGAYSENARNKIENSSASLSLDDITVRTLIEEDEFIRSLSNIFVQISAAVLSMAG